MFNLLKLHGIHFCKEELSKLKDIMNDKLLNIHQILYQEGLAASAKNQNIEQSHQS